jgi:hypothetical protein
MFFTDRSSQRFRPAVRTRMASRKTFRAGQLLERLEERALLSDYGFTVLQTIPGPAHNGAQWAFDLEPGDINNNGQVVFVADMTQGGSPIGEGIFTQDKAGSLTTLAFPGDTLPGGGVDAGFVFSYESINNRGDTAAAIQLLPFGDPVGVNSALYRHDAGSSSLTPLVLPGMDAPGGGQFVGVHYESDINNNRDVIFSGLVSGADIDPVNPPGVDGIGLCVFKVDAKGNITALVRSGDPVPGGGVFNSARPGTINNAGDVAFSGHNASLPCLGDPTPFYCNESVYLRDATTGTIIKVAQQGDPAPGGHTFNTAFDPRINSRGDVAFVGDFTPNGIKQDVGIYHYNRAKGTTVAIAQTGDSMPGGGHFVTDIDYSPGNLDLNDRGDVTFGATLDTDVNGDGIPDSGVYLWSHGTLSVIARTGTVIPGHRTLAEMQPPSPFAGSGGLSNDRGQVFLQGTLTDGTGVLLVATPNAETREGAIVFSPGHLAMQPTPRTDFAPLSLVDLAIEQLGTIPTTAKKKR